MSIVKSIVESVVQPMVIGIAEAVESGPTIPASAMFDVDGNVMYDIDGNIIEDIS